MLVFKLMYVGLCMFVSLPAVLWIQSDLFRIRLRLLGVQIRIRLLFFKAYGINEVVRNTGTLQSIENNFFVRYI